MPQSPLKAQLEKFKKKFARHLLLFIEKKSLDINVSFLLLSLEKLEYFDVRRGFSVLAGKKSLKWFRCLRANSWSPKKEGLVGWRT